MNDHKTISILGGGWSAKAIDKTRLPGIVIGVNDSAILAPKIDIAITMDRLWAEGRYDQLKHQHAPKPFFVRRSANKNLPPKPWIKVFDCDHQSTTFSDEPLVLNGTNSGFCAMNLAYQAKPSIIYLFGFDMNRSPVDNSPYWYAPYPWASPVGATTGGKYQAWAKQFEEAARQFEDAGIHVMNASMSSAIDAFQKTEPEKVLIPCAN